MKKHLLLASLLLTAAATYAQQSCEFKQLSNEFDIQMTGQTIVDPSDNMRHLSKIICTVNQKDGRLMQIISVVPTRNVLFNCTAQSYVTDYNTTGSRGNVIVADFNFDGLDDIAVERDMGSSKTYFDYYIQGKQGRFNMSRTLSNDLLGFPEVDKRAKTLTVEKPIDMRTVLAIVYRYDSQMDQLVKVREMKRAAHAH